MALSFVMMVWVPGWLGGLRRGVPVSGLSSGWIPNMDVCAKI